MSDGGGSFPRGFLLSLNPVAPPAGYVPGPVLANFHVHPWTVVEHAGDAEGRFVVVVGMCVSTVSESDTVPAAEGLLWAFQEGEAELLRALDRFCGRHAVIYGDRETVRVVADATSMRSVFYAGGVVASHAVLVERALGGEVARNGLPFRFGYPGNRTPYPRTRLLTANTLYDVTEGRVRRFWPNWSPPDRTVDDAAEEVLDRSVTALRNVARRRPVKVALTAGLDSRTLLAVAMRSGIEFETYTYGRSDDTAMDRAFSVDLAKHVGVRHSLVPSVPTDKALRKQLDAANYSNHHWPAVASLSAWIDDPDTAAVTANLLEIGRSFYKTRRDSGFAPPSTARAMAELHYGTMSGTGKRAARELGEDQYLAASTEAFEGFVEDTDYAASAGIIDPFDQFYWEHRMSAWHGSAMVERDFYGEPFIPFNARAIFAAILGVPPADRDAGSAQYRLIEQVDPRLLALPVNPPEWPQ